MSRHKFVARDGKRIAELDWTAKRADKAYTNLRLYDNGEVRILLAWHGCVTAAQAQTLPNYWPVFMIEVHNYNSIGALVVDPVDHGKTFATEVEAIAAYEKFLVKWTESTVNEETGELKEEGNIYTPPMPPDPNKPETDTPLLEGGAW